MDAVGIDTAEDAHEDTIEETVPEVCRVCLLGHVLMRDLFVENDVVSLSTKAMSFASVKMVPEDGLPAQVCCECADKLDAAYEFKLQVEQADNVLRQRYDGLNIKEELFFNEVEVHLEADRGDEAQNLDADAHYQATVDSLSAVDEGKPTLLKDHLALLEVEKLAKQQRSVLDAEHKHNVEMDEEAGVTEMLRVNDEETNYLRKSEERATELGDCGGDYGDSVKDESMHEPDAITIEEHNYIIQQNYTLARNVEHELGTEESVDSVVNETVNYLSLIDDDMSVRVTASETEISNIVKSEEKSDETSARGEKNEICQIETRRSKRKLSKLRRASDEDNYFENLNLSSRLKKKGQQPEKSEKLYFLCYLCDKKFISKDMLKDHMLRSHEEVRRALSLKKNDKTDKFETSPINAAATISSQSNNSVNSLSGKKANKCPYCGKEYLYVISFNKHLKQHEKSKEIFTKDSSFSHESSVNAEDSTDFVDYDARESMQNNSRVEASNDDDDDDNDDDDENGNDNENNDENNDHEADNDETLRNSTETNLSSKTTQVGSSSAVRVAYSCEKCMEKFANSRQLLDHTSEHFSNFKCNTCDREFEELEKLRRHRSEHVVDGVLSQQDLDDNVYAREYVNEATNDDENVIYGSDDLAVSHDVVMNSCDRPVDVRDPSVSGENESSSWHYAMMNESVENAELKANIRINEITDVWPDMKSQKCSNCTFACTSKKILARHVDNVTHICEHCKMSFVSRASLVEHAERENSCRFGTFGCTDCGKLFGNELTLRNHLIATDHKTIIHGEPYDPNKRIKRVAAKAAQRIIDKIKTEDNLEDYDDDEEEEEEEDQETKEENAENKIKTEEQENFSTSNTKIGNVPRWPRQANNEAASARKIQQHRNRNRRCDYECEICGRKCSSKQSLTKHMEQQHHHRAIKDEARGDKFEKFRRNETLEITERASTRVVQRKSGGSSTRRDDRTEDETENDDDDDDNETSDFESGLDWPIDNHECPTCKKKYSTKKSLLRHQLLHDEPNFECDICGVKFYRKDKLKSHYDKCSEKNPDRVRKCNICGDTFENNEILREHRARHVDEGILTAEDLRDIEPGSDERGETTKIARKRRTDIVGLECTECNKRYTSRKGLLRHIQVHEGKKYLCDICPKKFYRREHLKIHVAKHNMIKPYKCTRCTKRFIKEEQLSSHLSKHDRTFKKPKETDTSKRFLCEICSKSFTQSTTLIAHLRAHNGIKPYVCEVCARPFTTNAYLKMHMRTHTQERPYSCQYCLRAFARADTLANHLTSHTGEAKYHCKYCPKNFRRLKSLKEHVFIHTGQRPYACPTCDRRFNNNGSRYAHSKRCKQSLMQNSNRGQSINHAATMPTSPIMQNNAMTQPIRLHQLMGSHQLLTGHEEQQELQLMKSQGIKTITIARAGDQLTGHQMMQHQEILMPLILPLTVTLADVDEEVILPEGTKIYTTA